jgi:hypothetical protein
MRSLRVWLALVLSLAGSVAIAAPASAATLPWMLCGSCPNSPEAAVVGSTNTVLMGVSGRAEGDSQPEAIHGASAPLKPAKSYAVTFAFDLFTWDSYNAPAAEHGWWDSFSVSITTRPYWDLSVSDPITNASALKGLGWLWGGRNFGDGHLEHKSGKLTVTMRGSASRSNFLNVVLDTRTGTGVDADYPSWGSITIKKVVASSDSVAIGTLRWPFKNSTGSWCVANGYRGHYDHGAGGSSNNYAMFGLDLVRGGVDPGTGECTWSHTTGTDVYAPVSGVVSLVQTSCRAIWIKVNGAPRVRLELAHIDTTLGVGDKVTAGKTKLGTVSDAGCIGTGNHIHMALYYQPFASDSAENRIGLPFAGLWAVAGRGFPDEGVEYGHEGVVVP